MTEIYEIIVRGKVRETFEFDGARAESPIYLDGESTPFQTADARHDAHKAAKLLIDWARAQNVEIVSEDERWTIREQVRECVECCGIGRIDSDSEFSPA